MNIKLTAAILALCSTAGVSFGQVVLSGSSYTENFNNIGSASPTGWTLYIGATTTSLGTAQSYNSNQVTWGNGTAQFRNVAAITTGVEATDKGDQTIADRAMGFRQGSGFGDPGAAFVFGFDATGVTNISVSLDAMVQKVKTRSETWTLDYSINGGTSWTTITTWTDPGTFGTTRVSSSGSILALDGQSNALIRFAGLWENSSISVLNAIAIDDFSLAYTSAVPEPASFGLLAGLGVIGLASTRRRPRA